jgi:hypothetical protein
MYVICCDFWVVGLSGSDPSCVSKYSCPFVLLCPLLECRIVATQVKLFLLVCRLPLPLCQSICGGSVGALQTHLRVHLVLPLPLRHKAI